jgi:hypothetical protein
MPGLPQPLPSLLPPESLPRPPGDAIDSRTSSGPALAPPEGSRWSGGAWPAPTAAPPAGPVRAAAAAAATAAAAAAAPAGGGGGPQLTVGVGPAAARCCCSAATPSAAIVPASEEQAAKGDGEVDDAGEPPASSVPAPLAPSAPGRGTAMGAARPPGPPGCRGCCGRRGDARGLPSGDGGAPGAAGPPEGMGCSSGGAMKPPLSASASELPGRMRASRFSSVIVRMWATRKWGSPRTPPAAALPGGPAGVGGGAGAGAAVRVGAPFSGPGAGTGGVTSRGCSVGHAPPASPAALISCCCGAAVGRPGGCCPSGGGPTSRSRAASALGDTPATPAPGLGSAASPPPPPRPPGACRGVAPPPRPLAGAVLRLVCASVGSSEGCGDMLGAREPRADVDVNSRVRPDVSPRRLLITDGGRLAPVAASATKADATPVPLAPARTPAPLASPACAAEGG